MGWADWTMWCGGENSANLPESRCIILLGSESRQSLLIEVTRQRVEGSDEYIEPHIGPCMQKEGQTGGERRPSRMRFRMGRCCGAGLRPSRREGLSAVFAWRFRLEAVEKEGGVDVGGHNSFVRVDAVRKHTAALRRNLPVGAM